jgi:hypothetical protein
VGAFLVLNGCGVLRVVKKANGLGGAERREKRGGRELFKKEPEDISQSLCDISSG